MISVNLPQIRADVARLMYQYIDRPISRAMFEQFNQEFYDLLHRHDLDINVNIVRPGPADHSIVINPMKVSDAIVLLAIMPKDRHIIKIGDPAVQDYQDIHQAIRKHWGPII